MVTRFGMTAELGQVAYETEATPFLGGGGGWQPRRYGEATAGAIDTAIKTLIEQSFGRAVAILEKNRELLARTAVELLAKETMTDDELDNVRAAVVGEDTGLKPVAA
jgi:cell division protease FtsH